MHLTNKEAFCGRDLLSVVFTDVLDGGNFYPLWLCLAAIGALWPQFVRVYSACITGTAAVELTLASMLVAVGSSLWPRISQLQGAKLAIVSCLFTGPGMFYVFGEMPCLQNI